MQNELAASEELCRDRHKGKEGTCLGIWELRPESKVLIINIHINTTLNYFLLFLYLQKEFGPSSAYLRAVLRMLVMLMSYRYFEDEKD